MSDDDSARRMLTKREVCELIKEHPRTLERKIERGEFPKPVKTGVRSVRWFEDDVRAWQNDRKPFGYKPPPDPPTKKCA